MKENKRRQESADEAAEAKADTVKFTNWFSTKLRGHKQLRAHHYDSVWAFFKNKGLSQNESADKYEAALKAYGF